jgi:hypothetical protein
MVFRPQNPTSAPLLLTQVSPSRAWQYVVSLHYDTVIRETSEMTFRGVRAASHTCSALLAQTAQIPLRPPLHTSISRHSDWRATTHTSTLPSSAAEGSPVEAFALRRMRSSPRAERRRPGPWTADEPTIQNPHLPQVPACRDSHSTRSTTTTTTNNNNNNNNNNYCSCYFERNVAAPV